MATEEQKVKKVNLVVNAAAGEELPPGTLVGDRYTIEQMVASGNMGVLYKATHTGIGRQVAIKVLHEKLAHDDNQMQRFKQEARLAGSLNQANVCAVVDAGELPDGRPYLVMDFVDGIPLSKLIKESGGQLPEKRAIGIFLQICEGLKHAHGKGLVHRDLKPSNIMICRSGDSDLAKIVDFGIAKELNQEQAQHLTQTGEIFGSPLYMSPEQAQGFALDQRSDIYSLGCLMYETLTGQPPLRGENSVQTIVKHINEMPMRMSQVSPTMDIDPRLDDLVLSALQKDPGKRFQTVDALEMDLKSVRDGLWTPGSGTPSAVPRKPSYQPAIAAAGIALLIGAVVGYLLKPSELPAPPVVPTPPIHTAPAPVPVTPVSPVIPNFRSVELEGNVRAHIHIGGSSRSVDVHKSPGVSVTYSGNVLQLNGASSTPVEIQMPELKKIELDGNSVLQVDGVDGGRMDLDIGGNSHLTMKGKVDEVSLKAGGNSSVDLKQMPCDQADVNASGNSKVWVDATGMLKLDASGISHVYYKGSPGLMQSISGQADVTSF